MASPASTGAKRSALAEDLVDWYRSGKRDLPWRQTQNPYAIWVSEIMLQQTRVEAVIPYYQRFLQTFPTVQDLANASEEELLSSWSGLGYYSRVRNMQASARQIVARGGFPNTFEGILELPGIGDYTAAAVASIAFGLPYAVLDGNVLRVMSRIAGDFGDIASQATKKRFRDLAQRHLPEDAPGDYNQALMELGATVCLPKDPRCLLCPVSERCKARAEGWQDLLPTKVKRTVMVAVETTLLLAERQDAVLLWQRPEKNRMAGYWELPEAHMLPGAMLGIELRCFRHSIMSHAHRCIVLEATVDLVPPGFTWIPRAKLGQLPLSTMARKGLGLSASKSTRASTSRSA